MTHIRQLALAVFVACVGGLAIHGSTVATPPLRLATDGERFTVDGTPRFLTLVSYFDAMDATALDDDLAALARYVDGIRMFANWWDPGDGPCGFRFSPRTLFKRRADKTIAVEPDRLERLRHVLARARHHGLIVDLTFAAETVAGASNFHGDASGLVCVPHEFVNVVDWTAIAGAMSDTARALATPEHAHVFFDLQNEAGHNANNASDDDLRLLVDAVRRADPARLISVSMANPNADRQAGLVGRLGLSMLNFHDVPRGTGWGARTPGHVRRLRAELGRRGLRVPIYAGEPDPDAHDGGLQEFRHSLTGARGEGAGAWTLHTRAGFDLAASSLDRRLDPLTRRVLAAMRTW